MFKVPEDYRLNDRRHSMSSTKEHGNNGAFIIPHYKIRGYYFQIIASDGMGWEHVSVSLYKQISKAGRSKLVERTCTWDEMCYIKDLFWESDDCVIQFHPPKKDYVNLHPYVLHLWRPSNLDIERPPRVLIG